MIVSDWRVAAFVARKLENGGFVGPHQAIGLEQDGEIVAGGVFYFWTGHDVHLSIASERGRLSRELLDAWGKYVIRTLGCGRVTLITEQRQVVSMAKRLGGEIEGLLRNYYGPGRDAYVLGILAEHWRFV